MPRFSIVIPALNEEKYIGLTLKSIARQTFSDFEVVVVVDDRTRDATAEIAKEWGAKVLICGNHTVSDGRHMGALHSSGEILVFTDADTLMPPDFLEKVDREFRDEEVIALSGLALPYDAPLIGKIEYLVWSLARWVLNRLGKFFPPGYFTVVKKEAYFKIGGYVNMKMPCDISLDGKDGVFGLELARRVRGKKLYLLSIPIFPSSRRMHKLGFLKFNMYYSYILNHLFPSIKFFEKLAQMKKRLA